jgi:hypothetical protein
LISEQHLSFLRANQEKLMPDTVDQKRRVLTGTEIVLRPWRENLRCRKAAGYGFWRLSADRFQGITPYTFTFPYGTDVRASDVLVDEDSHSYEVRDVRSPHSYQTAVVVLTDQMK